MSQKKATYRAIPNLKTATSDIDALKENTEILTGQRGDGMDRALTPRDLQEAGLINLTRLGSGIKISTPTADPREDYTTDLTPPDQPTGLVAVGAFSNIILSWDDIPNLRVAMIPTAEGLHR
jgi:hypothetical protein